MCQQHEMSLGGHLVMAGEGRLSVLQGFAEALEREKSNFMHKKTGHFGPACVPRESRFSF